MHVVKTLTSTGFTQHSLDKMMFYLVKTLPGDEHPTLVAVLVAYVDDFMTRYNKRWPKEEMMQHFTQDELTLDRNLEFKGKTISLRYCEEKRQYYLFLTQTKFISSMKSGRVSAQKHDEQLDATDMPEYRSVAGCLRWLAGQTRPGIAATISLCSRGSKAAYKDLAMMYQAVDHLHATKGLGIHQNQ